MPAELFTAFAASPKPPAPALLHSRSAATCRRRRSPPTISAAIARDSDKQTTSVVKKIVDLADCSGTDNFARVSVTDVQAEWARHRSNSRYLRHALGLPASNLLWRVAPVCAFVGAESTALSLYARLAGVPLPHLSVLPFSLMSGVIGLLLVFRTNSSYERFVEGRIAWGTLVNRSRDLVRMTIVAMEAKNQNRIVRYTAAFCYCLKDHLRGATSGMLEASLEPLLEEGELSIVMNSTHRPNAVAMLISASIADDTVVERNMRAKLHEQVATLIDVLGISERILRTPIPLSYTRHTSRFCVPWCVLMPFVLTRDLGDVGGLVASVLITFGLLGIEDIGVNLEDPFRVLPLDQLCVTIRNNVFEIVENRQSAEDCIQFTRSDQE